MDFRNIVLVIFPPVRQVAKKGDDTWFLRATTVYERNDLPGPVSLVVEEFTFSNEGKARIVTDMVVAFQQSKLLLPSSGRSVEESRTVQDLEGGLFHFEPTVLRSGHLRYEAASGYHDDMVMALCLAYSGASFTPREPIVEVIELNPFAAYGDPGEGRFRWHIISRWFFGRCSEVNQNIEEEVRQA
jgi:hypothetical protein